MDLFISYYFVSYMDREIHNLSFCNFNACVATILHCISYQSLLSESPQLPYLILKHEITCIKGSKNTCFLIFYILSGTINQSIIWVASSSFMESSTYSPHDPHFKPFPFCVRESWRYQIRSIFGKVPKGRGVIFNPKIYIADF